MNKTKIESLAQNASTRINVKSIDEALEWVKQLQEEVRDEMIDRTLRLKVIKEYKDKIEGFIKMWTPPIRFAISYDKGLPQNANDSMAECCATDESHHCEVKGQLNEISQDLKALREESSCMKKMLSSFANGLSCLLRFWGKKKRTVERALDNGLFKYEEAVDESRTNATILQSSTSESIEPTSPTTPLSNYCLMLEIEDTRKQIEENVENWLSEFAKLVQYPNLKSGKSIGLIRDYIYELLNVNEVSMIHEVIKDLLTNYFDAQLVSYADEYMSSKYFDCNSSSQIKEAKTTRCALIYKDGIRKGMVLLPKNEENTH